MKDEGEERKLLSKRKGREIDSPGLELVHVGVHQTSFRLGPGPVSRKPRKIFESAKQFF